MTDVRSMLRSELSSRRIRHPHVSYTSSGLAQCNACQLLLRSDSLWEPHQRSKGHRLNVQKLQDGGGGGGSGESGNNNNNNNNNNNATSNGHVSKKRKVESDNEDEEEGRKKAKSTPQSMADIQRTGNISTHATNGKEEPSASSSVAAAAAAASATTAVTTATAVATEEEEITTEPSSIPVPQEPTPSSGALQAEESLEPSNQPQQKPQPLPTSVTAAPSETTTAVAAAAIDEDEWAAFEQEVVFPTHHADPSYANATITAAPVSAADLQTQSQVEAALTPTKKTLREQEIENEKEDAALQLEEEFDQMEELEQRVRRMKERREGIRLRRGTTEMGDTVDARRAVAEQDHSGYPRNGPDGSLPAEEDASSTTEDDDDDDEWGGWGIR